MSHDRVSIKDAAFLTGVPDRTIMRWIAEGRISGTTKPHRVSVSEVADMRKKLAPTCGTSWSIGGLLPP